MSGPAISVVVLPFSGCDDLIRCLDGLQQQTGIHDVEVLVPHDDTLSDTARLGARFPGVTFLQFTGRRTPAELRAKGVAAARAEVVALLEDHCQPEPDWCARMVACHAGPHAAIGGAVEKGFAPGRRDDSALNWAVYLTDYSRYMNPRAAGPTVSMTDTNSSYKRSELDGIRDAWAAEFHENVVNELLRARGRSLWFAPDVVVREQRTLTVRTALHDRYAFGRLFASTRVAGVPLSRRLFLAAASAIMPPVLVMRIAQTLFTRGRHRAQFLRSLPQLMLVTSAWMGGEIAGYLTARPEKTLSARSAEPTTGAPERAP
jgi:hypothetical protein